MAPFPAGTARPGTPPTPRRRPRGPAAELDDDAPVGVRRRAAGTATPRPDRAAVRTRHPRQPDRRVRRPRRWVVTAAVVAAVVLGASLAVDAGHPGHRASTGSVDGPAAGTTIAADVNGLASDLAGEEDTLRRCPPLATVGGLVCTEAADQRMGAELAAFVRAVARVRVPAAEAPAAARLRRHATTLSDDLMALGAAPTAASYTASADSRGVRPLGRTVDGDAKALVTALRR